MAKTTRTQTTPSARMQINFPKAINPSTSGSIHRECGPYITLLAEGYVASVYLYLLAYIGISKLVILVGGSFGLYIAYSTDYMY